MRLLSSFTPVLQRLREALDYLPAIRVVFLILKQSLLGGVCKISMPRAAQDDGREMGGEGGV